MLFVCTHYLKVFQVKCLLCLKDLFICNDDILQMETLIIYSDFTTLQEIVKIHILETKRKTSNMTISVYN